MTTLPSVAEILSIPARRKHNRDLALKLAEARLFIFPSIDKSPCVARWPERAEDISASEHGDAHFLGATRDPETIKAMWRAYPDAVPSISCGPSGVLVLDADAKKNGPTNLREWAAREGIELGKFPTTKTQSGGLHIFCKNDAGLGSAAGSFNDLGIDVRGNGGQVVAPGAIRADGRRYVRDNATPNLLDAVRNGNVPAMPEAVRQAIAARGQRSESNVAELLPRELERDIEALKSEDWPDFAVLTDSALGVYDLDALAEKDSEFRELRARGDKDGDRTDARFNLAKSLAREWPGMSVCEFAAILDGVNDEGGERFGVFVDDSTPSQDGGEYNFRNLARDFARGAAQGRKTGRLTDGAALGAVDDDDERPAAKKRRHGMLASEAVASWAPSDYLIKRLVPKRQLGMIYGPPDAKKSFTIIDVANHIARGHDWQGLRTKRAGVVYWHGEGQQGVAGRVQAWCDEYGAAGGDIWLDDRPLNFTKSAVGKEPGVGDAIKAMLDEAEAALGLKVELLIVDTLSKATIGMKANDETDAARVMANAEAVVKRLGVTILFVAHSGKDAERGVRGSNVLEGNVDFHLRMDKDGRLTVPRMKDGRKAEPRKLAFVEREICKDADGDVVTSLVIPKPKITTGESLGVVDEEAEAPILPTPEKPAPQPARPLTRKEQEAAERKAKADAHRHANSKEGRAETMLRAAADIGAGGQAFLLDELRDAVNAVRAESPQGLGGMAQSSFKGTLAQLREAGRIVWASGQTNLARYRLVG